MSSLSSIPENFLSEFRDLKERVKTLEEQLRRTGSGDMAEESISTPLIAGEAVINTKIAPEAVETDKIAPEAVIDTKIAPDNVNETHILVPDIGTINPDLGDITAGTITGAVHRTSPSNPKVQMDSSGFFATNASGTRIISVNNDGSIDSGVQSFQATEQSTTSIARSFVPGTAVTFPVKTGSHYSFYLEAEVKLDSNSNAPEIGVAETSGDDGFAMSVAAPLMLDATTTYRRQIGQIGGGLGAGEVVTGAAWIAIRASSATGNRTLQVWFASLDNATALRMRNIRLYAKTT